MSTAGTEQTGDPGQAAAPPVITVTRGQATHGELAAVVTVLLTARATAVPGTVMNHAQPSRWAAGSRRPSALPHPGPHSWRASALPR
ncbi:MAG TPA: acyl-CoA carboxylase subunit epsilon [Trebonia sp.]|jgi:hypothetical protein